MTTLKMNLGENSYPIIIGNKLLERANEYFDLSRKTLIVTDDGVPHKYSEQIAKLCNHPIVHSVKSGEVSKSFETLQELLMLMQQNEFGRSDCVVAVGGGVVGDLAGFAASIYMRGIDFYNVPTTLLSQVDSSIGGKTAINFLGVKNNIGSFKQPKCVLVDTDTLKTLSERQFASGLAEAIKMSLTSNAALFEKFEKLTKEAIYNNIEEIITDALMIKKHVVEQDEKESGFRKILNFGHTLGHGIESLEGLGGLTHGECVALGMLPMCSEDVNLRLLNVLKKVGLPYEYLGDTTKALEFVSHDKKLSGGWLSIICVDAPGDCKIQKINIEDFKKIILK